MERTPGSPIRLVLTARGPIDAIAVLKVLNQRAPMPITQAKPYVDTLRSGKSITLEFTDIVVAETFSQHCDKVQIDVILDGPATEDLRAVPDVLVARSDGKVVYNLIDPLRQKFVGRCVAALRAAGILVEVSADFSVVIGEGKLRIPLDEYWDRGGNDPQVFRVVQDAQRLLKGR
jgi:hypothetical protein